MGEWQCFCNFFAPFVPRYLPKIIAISSWLFKDIYIFLTLIYLNMPSSDLSNFSKMYLPSWFCLVIDRCSSRLKLWHNQILSVNNDLSSCKISKLKITWLVKRSGWTCSLSVFTLKALQIIGNPDEVARDLKWRLEDISISLLAQVCLQSGILVK